MAFDAALWSLGLSEEATALLNDNFDNLVNFVDPKHDRNRLKLWEPDTPGLSNDRREFLRGLRIPLWNKKPSLLLHELGSCAHDPTMQDRIGEVFRGGDMTCFVNSSGSGKTRHILEGLCLNWGFYLCLKEKTEDIGSVDMLGIQDRVELKKSHLTPNLPPKEDPTFVEKLIINQRLARACFSHVILARLLLFRMFLAAIMHSGRVISNADKWRWTLLQINPNLLGSPDGDIFDQLASILDSPTYEARRHPSSIGPVEFAVMSKVIMHKVTALLRVHSDLGINSGSQACRLYFVLDEAQIAAQALADAFRSQKLDPDTGDYVPRPLLREFLVVLEGLVLAKHGVIVTGTGLDIDLIEDAAKSVIYKGDVDDSIFTTDTGGFYDSKSKPAHLTYIKRYVPPDVLADESGQRLLERLPIWLTGRYRTTASLIVYLLQTDFKNPNDDFNNWVMYNTKFIPSDSPAQSAQISLPRDIEHRQDTLIKQLNYTKIVQDSDMRMLFENAVYQSFVRSSMTSMVVGKSRLMVECGFARFTDDYLSKVCIFEPLIILAALTRMEMGSNTRPAGSSRFSGSGQLLLHYTEQSIGTQKSAESNGYENYVALVLAKALGDFVPLQEIFSFHTIYRPAWIKRRARLVSVHLENASGPDSKPIKRSYEVNWPKYRLPSGHLGHTCNVKATLKWLKHEDPLRAAFCFPDSHMGPDIIFKLELDDGTFVWVVVQCKNHAKMQQNKSGFPKKTPEVIREAIKTVTPSEFWKNKVEAR
ncbi:hypothetical protein C8F01DRAFT_976075 [Mycena amicta]|nr:hypothetical protein C8F01DRAFT_976075 [Mycena amicta]